MSSYSIKNQKDWEWINPSLVEVVTVNDDSCNHREYTTINLNGFVHLKTLTICDNCFQYVNDLNMSGLKTLESVLIGKGCFTRKTGQFRIVGCPSLKELRIGLSSFSNFVVCDIENCALESIEMGDRDSDSRSFYYASLKMKRE